MTHHHVHDASLFRPPDACDADVPGSARCVGQHLCNGTNPMSERNYACDGAIRLFFGNRTTIDIDATGEAAFKGQMYQCQLVQAVVCGNFDITLFWTISHGFSALCSCYHPTRAVWCYTLFSNHAC